MAENQLSMLGELKPKPQDVSARARRTDPQSSKDAADRMNRSGWAKTHAGRIYEALTRNDGATAAELAEMTGLRWEAVNRRLPDLERLEHIERGPERLCRVRQANTLTWFVRRP